MPSRRSAPSRRDLAAGIDIGGTGINVAIVDREGNVQGRTSLETKPEGGIHRVINRAISGIDAACKEAGVPRSRLLCLGVGAPGAVDAEHGLVLEAVNLKWKNAPLRDLLRKSLKIPVSVDNDVTLAVLGENLYGNGNNATDLLGVWVGTGIGGGLILHGDIYYGHFRTAGEIGRGVVLPWSPPGAGSLEQVCSRTGIVETLQRLLRSGRHSIIPKLVDHDLDKIDSKVLAKAFKQNDELTVEVIEHAATVLGTAIGGMITFLSLGRVVLGGGLTEKLGPPFVRLVYRAAMRTVFPQRCRKAKIVPSRLWDDAACVGAAHQAFALLKK